MPVTRKSIIKLSKILSLMMPRNKYYRLIFFFVLFIIIKNIFFFVHAGSAGTWGINRASGWASDIILEIYTAVFVSAAVLFAAFFAAKGEKERPAFFILVSFLVFPFHILKQSYDRIFWSDWMPYPRLSNLSEMRMNWLAAHLPAVTALVFLILFSAGWIIISLMKKNVRLFSRIIFISFMIIFILSLLMCRHPFITGREANLQDTRLWVFICAMILSGSAVYFTNMSMCLRNTIYPVLSQRILYYIAFFINITIAAIFYFLVPQDYQLLFRYMGLAVHAAAGVTLFFYSAQKAKMLRLILVVLPLIIQYMMLIAFEFKLLFRNIMPSWKGYVFNWETIGMPILLLFVCPVLAVLFFRESDKSITA